MKSYMVVPMNDLRNKCLVKLSLKLMARIFTQCAENSDEFVNGADIPLDDGEVVTLKGVGEFNKGVCQAISRQN